MLAPSMWDLGGTLEDYIGKHISHPNFLISFSFFFVNLIKKFKFTQNSSNLQKENGHKSTEFMKV